MADLSQKDIDEQVYRAAAVKLAKALLCWKVAVGQRAWASVGASMWMCQKRRREAKLKALFSMWMRKHDNVIKARLLEKMRKNFLLRHALSSWRSFRMYTVADWWRKDRAQKKCCQRFISHSTVRRKVHRELLQRADEKWNWSNRQKAISIWKCWIDARNFLALRFWQSKLSRDAYLLSRSCFRWRLRTIEDLK
jgi:hypothetical protein